MKKRTSLFPLLWCALSIGAMAQIDCTTSTKLVCEIPVASRAQHPETVINPAQAINATFAAQLTQLPLPSSATGIEFVFDKSINDYRPLENLGPILIDRARTIGKKRLFLGFAFQQFTFNSINGNNLGAVPFVFQSTTCPLSGPCPAGNVDQYAVQTEHISLKLDQYVILANYGLTNTTDVSVIIPIERVSIGVGGGGTEYIYDHSTGILLGSLPSPVPYTAGVASGIGDFIVNVKHEFFEREGKNFHFSGGLLLRFPTGDALNYLGSGAYGFNPYGVISYSARVTPHARLGYIWNTDTVLIQTPDPSDPSHYSKQRLPGGFQYDFGADAKLFQRVTAAADLFGNQFQNSPALVLASQPIPTNLAPSSPCNGQTPPPSGCTAPTVKPVNSSYTSTDFSVGLKWKPWEKNNLLFFGNVLIPINNVGMRSDPAPLFGISYTFGF